MLPGLLKWCLSSSSTPQDVFQRTHARLACPPLLSLSGADSSGAASPQSRVVDPYHFIVCQHGVLGSAADFENIIVDSFVHHEVSVLEVTKMVVTAEREESAEMPAGECAADRGVRVRGEFSGPPLPFYGSPRPTYHLSSVPSSASVPAACISGTSGACHTVVSPMSSVPTVPESTASSVSSMNGNVMPRAELKKVLLEATSMKAAAAQQHQRQPASMCDIADAADKASGLQEVAPVSNFDNALAAEQHARRAAYRAAYRLQIEYPNRMNGRLYRSGNLQCFSPGSNEYLRTDAGTQVCARRMLAEVVPALHTWLNEVESKEQQRRAKWAVYAHTVGTSDAARLSAEAAAPLPICFSVMAHSFGGIIQREFLYLLLVDQTETRASDAMLFHDIVTLRQRLQRLHVTFENFLTVATPHCGAGECLWWPIYFGAWCLARMKLCQTYDELILSDANRIFQRRLLDEPHLRVLQLFRRRVLFANTHRDILVGFGTCSLIFENVDTDHTKFIGVAPGTAHCAAAFANEATEVSKPILLRSFEEMEDEEADGGGGSNNSSVRHDFQLSASARARSYTMDDLASALAPSSAAAATVVRQVSYPSARKCAGMPVSVMEGDSDDSDFLTATLRPQATSSSASGLTASPTSTPPSYSQSPMPESITATRMQSSVFAALRTIGRTVPVHGEETVRVEDVAVPLAEHIDEGRNELDSGSQSSASGASTVGSLLSRPFSLLRRRDSLILPSPLLKRFVCSRSEAAATSDAHDLGDVGSVTSSRRSRNSSTVTSLLRDPRWASERVRRVASTVHAEVERWLWAPTTTPKIGETSTSGESNRAAAAAAESVTAFSKRTSLVASAQSPMALLMSGTGADVPEYHRAPRAIAATLRRKMSWRVRAIRLDNILPAGHVACLGNWAFFGRSPSVVQAAAEELLIIL
ncbi:conserved hypothetical protein [Leishmania mexicana MHOM/GT/2001/U1103]|uniref:DUF676 domain-containing protein n=1 Tax=Leishmania mexicana (strain MHOM/GT/2001/U1103) TaxID=929439 RepID=E9AW93_LEIMU|nr:conserved hypothetical protein [Leishmania mexicana MHOM/GT/2001/U1103]CBZ27227.1 conserved hypothetical protein [Leishmania mexicana MHOM/GT/2001/U1103]